ncbi:hypothetical protein F0562_013439 [Nyssa sinensis]|uniref:PUM-HD domain-containing protein n=1 Tax=Nyssa sinensis TaxID=561372 RepID=A0A5J4ZK79_9ASTE|nr:hypothetical protein F0562_013439 [Nyssa sinensis]
MSSCYGRPSGSNSMDQFTGNSVVSVPAAAASSSLSLGNYMMNNNLDSYHMTQGQGRLMNNNMVMVARNQPYSGETMLVAQLQQILQSRNEMSTRMIFELMKDPHGDFLFQELIDASQSEQLELILWKIISQSESLIDAAFNPHGPHSKETHPKTEQFMSASILRLSTDFRSIKWTL